MREITFRDFILEGVGINFDNESYDMLFEFQVYESACLESLKCELMPKSKFELLSTPIFETAASEKASTIKTSILTRIKNIFITIAKAVKNFFVNIDKKIKKNITATKINISSLNKSLELANEMNVQLNSKLEEMKKRVNENDEELMETRSRLEQCLQYIDELQEKAAKDLDTIINQKSIIDRAAEKIMSMDAVNEELSKEVSELQSNLNKFAKSSKRDKKDIEDALYYISQFTLADPLVDAPMFVINFDKNVKALDDIFSDIGINPANRSSMVTILDDLVSSTKRSQINKLSKIQKDINDLHKEVEHSDWNTTGTSTEKVPYSFIFNKVKNAGPTIDSIISSLESIPVKDDPAQRMLDNNLQNQRLIDQARSVNKNYDFNVFLKSLIALSIAFKGYTARVMWYHNHIVKMRAWANGSSDQLTEMIEKINKLRNQSWLRKLINFVIRVD